jgi:hypothetical protein
MLILELLEGDFSGDEICLECILWIWIAEIVFRYPE